MIRLRGKGVPVIRGRGKGDEYVKLDVIIPERLNKEQKNLLEEIKKEGL